MIESSSSLSPREPQRRSTRPASQALWRKLVPLALSLAACLGVAGLGGAFTSTSVGDWYPTLSKPSWNPPSWVFGPVWTVLYSLMAVAAWRIWLRGPRAHWGALALFGAQLLLNLGWSWVFFGCRAPGWAVLEISALWLAIVATLVSFWRVDRLAGLLLTPYLAWVSFAAALNLAIWRLNA